MRVCVQIGLHANVTSLFLCRSECFGSIVATQHHTRGRSGARRTRQHFHNVPSLDVVVCCLLTFNGSDSLLKIFKTICLRDVLESSICLDGLEALARRWQFFPHLYPLMCAYLLCYCSCVVGIDNDDRLLQRLWEFVFWPSIRSHFSLLSAHAPRQEVFMSSFVVCQVFVDVSISMGETLNYVVVVGLW